MKVLNLSNDQYMPLSLKSVGHLKNKELLRSALGKLSPSVCAEIGLSEDEGAALESLYLLFENEDFRVIEGDELDDAPARRWDGNLKTYVHT